MTKGAIAFAVVTSFPKIVSLLSLILYPVVLRTQTNNTSWGQGVAWTCSAVWRLLHVKHDVPSATVWSPTPPRSSHNKKWWDKVTGRMKE